MVPSAPAWSLRLSASYQYKDVLTAIQKSFVICGYKCHCDIRYVGRTSQRLQNRIKQHVQQSLRQQLTRPRRSQPHRSCKRNHTKPDCDSAIGQHLLEHDYCALNYDNKRFSILATAHSFSISIISYKLLLSRPSARCYAERKNLFTLSNSFDNRGVPIWPLAVLYLAFRYCEIFLWRALQY